jgi:uncharacterized protein (TIGR03086 family)
MTKSLEVHMIDLRPATSELARVVGRIRDEQLAAPTPCAGTAVGRMLVHVDGLSVAFARAAAKSAEESTGGIAEDGKLVDGWRERIPAQLEAMADAWDEPSAWSGQTRIGGTDQPGEVCGLIALDEVIVHGWDLATATGQPYAVDDHLAVAAVGFVGPAAEQNPDGIPGLFGPAVRVPADASPLDRLLGLTGRDPRWRPS